jgi:hypothetical protein
LQEEDSLDAESPQVGFFFLFSIEMLLVLYAFHTLTERVQHFVKHCVVENADVDYILIANDISFQFKDAFPELPEGVLCLCRENVG